MPTLRQADPYLQQSERSRGPAAGSNARVASPPTAGRGLRAISEGELAALRVPDLHPVGNTNPVTVRTLADRWQASRVDVSAGTMQTYRVALGRLLPRLGDRPVDSIDAQTVAELVAELHAAGLKKQTIRKTLSVLAMVFDHGRRRAEPGARQADGEAAARGAARTVKPPTAEHVEAVVRLLPTPLPAARARPRRDRDADRRARAAHLGRRRRAAAALARLGDRGEDGPRPVGSGAGRAVRGRARRSCARDDRVPERHVFQGFGGDRFRTAITRACTAAGVPAFSPHDLRHRRVSLLHLGGMPWARIGELVGHDDLMTTARTYTHVVGDEGELDYADFVKLPL